MLPLRYNAEWRALSTVGRRMSAVTGHDTSRAVSESVRLQVHPVRQMEWIRRDTNPPIVAAHHNIAFIAPRQPGKIFTISRFRRADSSRPRTVTARVAPFLKVPPAGTVGGAARCSDSLVQERPSRNRSAWGYGIQP